MVLKRICRDLLLEKEDHCTVILEQKGAQCSKQSREYTELILEEQKAASDRLLEEKNLQLEYVTRSNAQFFEHYEIRQYQADNFTQELTNEKASHLHDLQKAMYQQQIIFCVFAVIAIAIILSLMVVASIEKRRMDSKCETILQEKSETISKLEKQIEEEREKNEKNSKETAVAAPQMPAHHPFMYSLPNMMPTMGVAYSSISPTIQLAGDNNSGD